jgi:hypothetical protein
VAVAGWSALWQSKRCGAVCKVLCRAPSTPPSKKPPFVAEGRAPFWVWQHSLGHVDWMEMIRNDSNWFEMMDGEADSNWFELREMNLISAVAQCQGDGAPRPMRRTFSGQFLQRTLSEEQMASGRNCRAPVPSDFEQMICLKLYDYMTFMTNYMIYLQ